MTTPQAVLLEAAWSHFRSGALETASAEVRELLRQDPTDVGAWSCLGCLEAERGAWDEARMAFEQALVLNPDHGPSRTQLALVEVHSGRFDEAEGQARRVLARNPSEGAARMILVEALLGRGALDQARHEFSRIQPSPGLQASLQNLEARLLAREGNLEGLRSEMERRVLGFAGPRAVWEQSNISLQFGDMPRGWDEYEARWEVPGLMPQRWDLPLPRWDGTPFPGKTLLLCWEQGLGDTLMFIRFAAQAKRLGGRVVALVQAPVADLVATAAGVDAVVVQGAPLPACDCYLPLLSLPRVLRTTLETLPAGVPYLSVPELVPGQPALDERIDPSEGLVRIGLTWEGTCPPRERHMKPEVLAPLADLDGVCWFSFQFPQGPLPPLPGIVDLAPYLKGFANTAYAARRMDLVITIDSAMAHLAGALGIPTLLLLEHLPEWRWMLQREDSPWYPTLRLYRQPRVGDWAAVVQQLRQDLEA